MKYTALICILLGLSAFNIEEKPEDTDYKNQIELWHQQRVNTLKSESGWLNVVGLYWLEEGENTFGTAIGNKVIFPKGKAENKLGTFVLKNGIVTLNVLPGIQIRANNELFSKGVIFDGTNTKPLVLSYKSLSWFIIKRGNKYGVRLRDFESESLKNFTRIDRFPVEESWKIEGTFEAPASPKTIAITDVIGLTSEQPLAGTLSFEIQGKKYKLDATGEGNSLFIVFADQTSGKTTYGGGRFLYVPKPADGNKVVIDFNKSINPPCAFTAFATCPLPPLQNRLAANIQAGEKVYGDH